MDRSTLTSIYTKKEKDIQTNGIAGRKEGREIGKYVTYSRMELELQYRVHWAKRLKRGPRETSKTYNRNVIK